MRVTSLNIGGQTIHLFSGYKATIAIKIFLSSGMITVKFLQRSEMARTDDLVCYST